MKKSLLLSFAFMLLFGAVFSQNNNTSDSPAFQCGSTFSDVDGNIYQTVYVAGYCWMKSNLKVAHYAGDASAISRAMVYRSPLHPNEIENDSIFGRLYTWYSAVNVPENSTMPPAMDEEGYVRGACPAGWHIPTAEEMAALRNLSAVSLRSTEHWLHPENNTNSTGFTALPAGTYNAALNRYENLLDRTGFWSVDGGTMIGEGLDATYLYYYCEDPMTSMTPKADGLSVRCVLGGASGDAIVPTLSPSCNVGDVNPTSATATCEVTSDGGASVTARGVCWGTSSGPTLADSHTSNGVGIGAFSCSMTGLTPNTTYYVRPYAVNGAGTAYGEEVTFTTPCWAVEVTISGATNLCEGETATLTASGAQTYAWNTGVNSAAITVNTSGTYTVTGYDGYHCPGTASKTVTVTSCATIPTVTVSVDGNSVTHSSATVTGEVTSDGGSPITGYGFCWGTGSDPDITGTHSTNVPGAGGFTGSFSETLTGLLPNTTYCVRSYATNSEGTSYGTAVCFTTPCWAVNVSITGETSICTGESTTLTASGASSYEWRKGTSTTVIGTDATLTVSTSGTYYVTGHDGYHCPGTDSKTVTVHVPQHGSVTVNVCPSDLPYSWHGTEYPQAGDYTYAHTDNDGCLQVDTLHLVLANCAVAPTVTVNVEDGGVNSTSATVNGNVTSDGGAPITGYGFCWGTGTDPDITGTHSTNVPGDGGFSGGFSETLTGLSPNTTYYVRSYATNSAGTSYGTSVWFTTSCWTVDVSITGETSICTGESTTLTASGASSYEWRKGTTTSDIIGTDETLNVSTSGTYYVKGYDGYHCPGTASKTVTVHVPQHGSVTVSVCPSDLPYSWHGTEYPQAGDYTYAHTDNDGCLQVDTLHLVLENCAQDPTVTTNAATSITETAAILNGTIVNPDNVAITAKGFEWKATEGGTYAAVDVTGEAMTYDLASLTPNTGYIYKAFITYGGNTVYGDELTFTTPCWTVNVTILGESEMCEGASTTLTASGASTYEWRKGTTTSDIIGTDATLAVSTSGTYHVKGYDGYHCPGTASKTVTVHVPQHGSVTESVCTDDLPYSWHGVEYPEAGDYTYAHMDNYGCLQVDTLHLIVKNCVMPIAITNSVSDLWTNFATIKGSIYNPDNVNCVAQGFEWKPTAATTYTVVNVPGTSMVHYLRGLTDNTSYTYRAFVTTLEGTNYGTEVSFTTLSSVVEGKPCPGTPTVTDVDLNTYNTVQIGDQCWMRENLKTTKFADGTDISLGTSANKTRALRMWPNLTSSYVNGYGYLYNWSAVMHGDISSNTNPSGVQGICPDGWHVPSDVEWTIMEQNLTYMNVTGTGFRGNHAAKMAGGSNWSSSTNSDAAGNMYAANRNISGFTAVPAGSYEGAANQTILTYSYLNSRAFFWSSTEYNNNNSFYRGLYNYESRVYRSSGGKQDGFSVRCLKNTSIAPPRLGSATAKVFEETSALLYFKYSNPDNIVFNNQGFEWKDIANLSYNQATGTISGDTINVVLTNLSPGTTYKVRAFIAYSDTIIYGEEMTFALVQPCFGIPTVMDADNNVYHTVQIGTQCWLVENLRTTKYSSGTSIAYGDETSATTPYWYYPACDSLKKEKYGLLYNWAASLKSICPSGWHVPSDNEFSTLVNYVSGQSSYLCNTDNTSTAKALANTTGWSNSTVSCAVGNDQSVNNATGFSAMPAGVCFSTILYQYLGSNAEYWTTTPYNSDDADAWYRTITNSKANVGRYRGDKRIGMSVRCLRTAPTIPTVTTGDATDVQSTSVILNGAILNPSNFVETSKGFEWKSTEGGTYEAVEVTSGTLAYNLTGLNVNTTYIYRAFVIIMGRTIYGEEKIFTTACPVVNVTISGQAEICNGESAMLTASGVSTYLWSNDNQGDVITVTPQNSNTYTVTGTDVYGCMGTATHSVTVNPTYNTPLVAEICQGENYDFFGELLTTTGTYTHTLQSVHGCDSVLTLTLTVNQCGVQSEKPCTIPTTHLAQTSTTYQGNGFNGANYGLETVVNNKINSVTDYDGNVYPVVQIGSQCWLAENMRCTHSPSTGTYIVDHNVPSSSNSTFTGKQARWYNNDSVTSVSQSYGLLYNWNAAVDVYNNTFSEKSINTNSENAVNVVFDGNRQGICPNGWHVPSDAEWTTFNNYMSGQSEYQCGGNSNNIGKALASENGWNSYDGDCVPGNQSQHVNNSSGLGAIPVGSYGNDFYQNGVGAFFWSSTQYENTTSFLHVAHLRSIYYNNPSLSKLGGWKSNGNSVRCLRD